MTRHARHRAGALLLATGGALTLLATSCSAFSLAPPAALRANAGVARHGIAGARPAGGCVPGGRVRAAALRRGGVVAGVSGLRASGEDQGSGGMVEKVKAEAQDALSFVGWADGREEGDEGPVIR